MWHLLDRFQVQFLLQKGTSGNKFSTVCVSELWTSLTWLKWFSSRHQLPQKYFILQKWIKVIEKVIIYLFSLNLWHTLYDAQNLMSNYFVSSLFWQLMTFISTSVEYRCRAMPRKYFHHQRRETQIAVDKISESEASFLTKLTP